MTTKTKAKEIALKYYNGINGMCEDSISFRQANMCATICVDEILSICTQSKFIDYWTEVKLEIEKL